MPLIGVLSDTHVQSGSSAAMFLLEQLSHHLADADLILHAGDIVDLDFLSSFEQPLYAVRGNLDPSDPSLPPKRVFEFSSWRFGLIHGWGAPAGLAQRVQHEFSAFPLDCIVFGHSHYPYNQRHGSTLLFNPGSASDRRSAPFHSVGIIEVGSALTGKIIPLD